MTETPRRTYHATDLVCRYSELFQADVELFAADGPDKLAAVFDFDKTLTPNKPGDPTSWDPATNAMSEELRAEQIEEDSRYTAIEERRVPNKDGKLEGLTQDEIWTWWGNTLGRYIRGKVDFNKAGDEAAEKIKLRDHVADLFKTFEAANIPTIVVSAGLKTIVKRVLDASDIRPSLIVSTDLELDENGIIKGWDPEQAVHNHNKWQRSRQELLGVIGTRTNVLLAGDSFEDPKMVQETLENGLRVIRTRVGDAHNINFSQATEYFAKSYDAGYNAVSVNGIAPVAAMGKYIIDGSIE